VSTPPGGKFVGRNVSLQILIGFVYDVKGFQILGGPDWLPSVGFSRLLGHSVIDKTGLKGFVRLQAHLDARAV
jgi:hypothetical protein